MAKDYYETLRVPKSASKDEVKRAFYKLAQKYHPDKKGGNEDKFKQVNEAYQTLSDDAKRSKYDQYGSGFENMGAPPPKATATRGAVLRDLISVVSKMAVWISIWGI